MPVDAAELVEELALAGDPFAFDELDEKRYMAPSECADDDTKG